MLQCIRNCHFLAPFLLAALLTAACASSYPLGLSEAEWQALSTEQKLEARKTAAEQQRQREQAEADRRAKAEAHRRELQAEIDKLYARELADNDAGLKHGGFSLGRGPGQISQVQIRGGEVRVPVGGGFSLDSGWRPHGVTSFPLAECEAKQITLRRRDKSGQTHIFAKRYRGQIYLSATRLALRCSEPPSYIRRLVGPLPTHGQGRVTIDKRVRNALVRVYPWRH